MRLKDYVKPELVFPEIFADDRQELNAIIVGIFNKLNPGLDHKALQRDLDSQDRVACSDGDCVVGVPNAFVQGLSQINCYVVRVCPRTEDPEPGTTRIGFFVFSPSEQSMDHLKLIARISRFACHPEFCCDLVKLKSAKELYDRIIEEDEQHV